MGLSAFVRALFSGRDRRVAVVTCDEQGVTSRHVNGLVETVRWDELQKVEVLTTDDGPARDDVFWVLHGHSKGCVVPSEAEGAAALLSRLQQLPGFDNEAVMRAMGSVENAAFLCWRRPGD